MFVAVNISYGYEPLNAVCGIFDTPEDAESKLLETGWIKRESGYFRGSYERIKIIEYPVGVLITK
jgi:hypothetical protein